MADGNVGKVPWSQLRQQSLKEQNHREVDAPIVLQPPSASSGVFINWDNSNLFIEAQRKAGYSNGEMPGVCHRVQLHFENLLQLAKANKKLVKAVAAGSIPP